MLAPAILSHDVESFKMVQSPLDVLAQVIVSMVGVEAWDIDRLHTDLKASYPYRNLSPFVQSDWWRQVSQYMYMDDSLKPDKRSRLWESLLREVVFTPGLRPTVSRRVIERFEMKRKRLSPGYSPQTVRELLDWVVEWVAIPKDEWEDLL